MRKIKLALTTLALLSLGSFADAGCLRCEAGHVICHGTCDDPIQGRAKEILGKRFCLAQDSSSHLRELPINNLPAFDLIFLGHNGNLLS